MLLMSHYAGQGRCLIAQWRSNGYRRATLVERMGCKHGGGDALAGSPVPRQPYASRIGRIDC